MVVVGTGMGRLVDGTTVVTGVLVEAGVFQSSGTGLVVVAVGTSRATGSGWLPHPNPAETTTVTSRAVAGRIRPRLKPRSGPRPPTARRTGRSPSHRKWQ